jgi:cob(I)alamin adenosyltransferase
MVKLFTGRGDDGTTGLLHGGRLSKADIRMEAIGTLDELNATLANTKCLEVTSGDRQILERIQKDLYQLMAELASEKADDSMKYRLSAEQVVFLEQSLQKVGEQVEMPRGFILAGATQTAAAFDLCRTVARRAERRVVDLNAHSNLDNPQVMRYLNRLSSLLYLFEIYYSKLTDTQNITYTKDL